MLSKKWILLISVFVLIFLSLACVEGGDFGTPVPPATVEVSPEGMERFDKEEIEEHGCPDEEKTPTWLEIPECENEVSED